MATTYEEVETDTHIAMGVFDKDNNGLITLDEFYDTFKNNGYDVDKEELSIIVENNMSEEEHSVGVIFNAFDLNKDGRLTFSDMRLGFQNMGVDIADEELKEMMDAVDEDGDGAINFSEMLTIMIRMHNQNRKQMELVKVFEILDKDGNKRISKSELKKALKLYGCKKVSNEELDKIMKEVDFDNDGFISFVEFSQNVHLFQ